MVQYSKMPIVQNFSSTVEPTGICNEPTTVQRTHCLCIVSSDVLLQCQSAALDELFGNPEECFNRYETAFTILHSLHQQADTENDKTVLQRYKDAVQKRLMILHNKGYISAYETTF